MLFDDLQRELLGMPIRASVHGADVDKLINYLHRLMGVLFVGWLAYFVYCIIRFRQANQPKASYSGVTSHLSSYLEVGVAIIEGILLLGFAVPLWAKSVNAEHFPDAKTATVIRVTGQQFFWTAWYPGADGVFGSNRIDLVSAQNPLGIDPADPAGKDDVITEKRPVTVPVDKPVILRISSKDVIHCFKVPPLRITQDAIPGMTIPIHFKPTQTNTFQIQCAQLCGNGHYSMKELFKIVSAEEYAAFLKANGGAAAKGGGGFE